jgi:hypothetical protein
MITKDGRPTALANVRSMSDSLSAGPNLDDAKALIERLLPRDRAMLRPWVLARFSVSGDVHRDIVDREVARDDEHRLRRT